MTVAKLAPRPTSKDRAAARPPGLARPALRVMAPIVPPASIAGRALVAVIAIMGFLACLTVGSVTLVTNAAREWQSDVARELTIQVRPRDGTDVDRDVSRAADIARHTPGINTVRVLSRAENEALLTPWLGGIVALDTLPVPRLIVLDVDRAVAPDIAELRAALSRAVPNAALDDHRQWRDRLAAMTQAVVAIGTMILVLVLAATALSVVFATRGAMAANRDIVEVLHLVGAENRYIAGTFQKRFMTLGLQGGAMGGAAAIVAFHVGAIVARIVTGEDGRVQLDVLLGSVAFGVSGYAGILLTVVAVAVVTAVTSRWTVRTYLKERRP